MRRLLHAALLAAALLGRPATTWAQPVDPAPADAPAEQHDDTETGADVKSIVVDSVRLLMLEHLGRLTFEEKTRRELDGHFWRDYRRAIRVPPGWEDGDGWFTNYIGHPIHGAAAGFIWVQNDPRGRERRFGLDATYWASRGRAAAWIAGYSLQFEFGPLSEASIGNVGLVPDTSGWVDHAITPIGGFGLMIAEDALDQYFLQWFERRVRNPWARGTMRILFNPSRSLANVADLRAPWRRLDRDLHGR